MKYNIYASINKQKLGKHYETITNIPCFISKLKFFTEIGYTIHKIERVE